MQPYVIDGGMSKGPNRSNHVDANPGASPVTPGWKPLTWHPKPRLTPLLPFLLQTYQGVVRVGMAG